MYTLRFIERKSGQLLLTVRASCVPDKGEFVTIGGSAYRVYRRHWHPVDHFVDIKLKEKR